MTWGQSNMTVAQPKWQKGQVVEGFFRGNEILPSFVGIIMIYYRH